MAGSVAEPARQYNLTELAALLVRDQGLHEGLYSLVVEFQVAVGSVGPSPDMIMPGAMVGFSKIGLLPATKPGPNTVDAAEVNPKKQTRRKVVGN